MLGMRATRLKVVVMGTSSAGICWFHAFPPDAKGRLWDPSSGPTSWMWRLGVNGSYHRNLHNDVNDASAFLKVAKISFGYLSFSPPFFQLGLFFEAFFWKVGISQQVSFCNPTDPSWSTMLQPGKHSFLHHIIKHGYDITFSWKLKWHKYLKYILIYPTYIYIWLCFFLRDEWPHYFSLQASRT